MKIAKNNMLDKLDKILLYFVELDESIPFDQYSDLLSLLSKEKQEQIQKFHFEVDKKLSLLSDVLVRYVACNLLGVSNVDLLFQKNEYGKPHLVGIDNFHYNISHTRNAFVVGVSKETIGVDIEKIRECEMKIANRFFTTEEVQYIKKGDKEVSKRFYEIWTKKEAYIKWRGKGLSIPLDSFNVVSNTLLCEFWSIQKTGYQIAVCHRIDDIGNVIEFEEKELFEIIENSANAFK